MAGRRKKSERTEDPPAPGPDWNTRLRRGHPIHPGLVRAGAKDAVRRSGDVMLDLSGLTFVDVGGATALVLAAQDLDGRRRLVIRGPPPTPWRTWAALLPDSVAIEAMTHVRG
ncbi:STAS domain-containing protein [Streptomyces botrytidirepellens]|uniref:STAS domain-containing protein n=1 Tax=Streptomyces botrytidirepellens TaxID=2486417 RepID=A0A3M8WA50_9ACTN|nr:STAS domain-containing protein [Streptomyces botrytidirepellens]RNG27002.1 STAS domain-containing protein [Streptomyces botrytidirepellens]